MACIVWPQENNRLWPLPADYADLTSDGQKLARVNAVSLTGRPDLDVAAWAFMREYYLFPTPKGMWYKTGVLPSPDDHYKWVHDWSTYRLCLHAAPRAGAKSTITRENILRKLLTTPYWETLLFLAKQEFVSDCIGTMMAQIEHNDRIVADFGKLKPSRMEGRWNRGSQIELKNGAKLTGMPIMGASLGKRPSGEIILDDVEKADDMVVSPSDLREAFEKFFFNAIFPMAEEGVPIRIIGTLLNRRTFIHYLQTTDDPRITKYWHRELSTVKTMDWKEKMGEEWQVRQLDMIGPAAFNAQYMNAPGTDADRILKIDPELTTYWLEDQDDAATNDPLNSEAIVVTHTLRGFRDTLDGEKLPIPAAHHRTWGKVVQDMRRFITVDTARTTSKTSDFSCIHVMGFENTHKHRDTLYSLDMWLGRKRPEEIIRVLYQMAIKWDVWLIGVEAYPLLSEFYERCKNDLPDMFGKRNVPPRIIALKFPTRIDKASKIMSMEWRFRHNRVKLPTDRRHEPGYARLFYEIENFTEDMALLDHDDAIDTLAMHQLIGKQGKSVGPDIEKPLDLIERLKDGDSEELGIPLMSGINASDLSNEDVRALLDRRYEAAEEEHGPIDQWWTGWIPFE